MRGRVHSRWSFVAAAQAFRTARGERHDGSLSLRRPRLRFYDGTNKMVDGASLNGVESTLKCPIASTGERPKLAVPRRRPRPLVFTVPIAPRKKKSTVQYGWPFFNAAAPG